jgi:signal transduction histidine kinase/ActR/RegA family two-component response regulator
MLSHGDEFLTWLVGHLSRTLECEWAFVWELAGDRWQSARTIAASRRGDPFDVVVEVKRDRTPLADGASLVVPRELRARFPHVRPFETLAAESCVGIALHCPTERPTGHLTLLDTKPIFEPKRLIVALEQYRERVEGELASRMAVRELERLVDTTSSTSTTDVMQSVAAGLSRALHAKCGFVCDLVPERPGRVRTLALVVDGVPEPALEYELAATPCGVVMEHGSHFVGRDVQRDFPRDVALRESAAQAYLGVRLDGPRGEPLGIVGVVHDQPLGERLAELPIVRLHAERAAAELARRRFAEEKIAVERRLLQAQKFESLGVLAGGIAHDFNNLLMGVLGHAGLARLEAPAESDALRQHLEEIEGAGRRAAELSRQLLAFAGRGRFELRPLDLTELVDESLRATRGSLPENVVVETHLDDGLPAVRADAAQIGQVVTHLVLNAAESLGEKGGTVTVTTGHETLGHEALARFGAANLGGGEYVFLEVSDTGCGMDESTRARLFEPFFTTKATGRGLGLAAAQGIVRAHHGVITVETEVDRGTTFRVHLLATDESARPFESQLATVARPAATAADAAASRPLVLVVDDEELTRAATAKMLERLGHRVVTAASGRAGVATLLARRDEVALVLLDVTMPHFSGAETLREMRRVRPDVRVVLMSGFTETEAITRFAGLGVAGFLEKPFALDELERAVDAAFGSTTTRTTRPPPEPPPAAEEEASA